MRKTLGKDEYQRLGHLEFIKELCDKKEALKQRVAEKLALLNHDFWESTFAELTEINCPVGSALPVGVPVPWPSATPPTGWLKCNGAAFSAKEYPELAKAYSTNKLPDLRGEFIRGWDDGRGVDSGRTLLTNQEHAVISHNHGIPTKVGSVTNIPYGIEQVISDETIFSSAKTVGVDYWSNSERVFTYTSGGRNGAESVSSPDASSLIKETRPRNLAFAYIVRAA
ncbi:tail fiber protein [Escherichia coli]|uniref:tail fiber protein n=1 Tax=Escherichia coli TaxID=562 RepID=UPI003F760003